MIAAAGTVATQALQVWLRTDTAGLGVDGADTVGGGYLAPLDTWCDMTHLLGREGWAPADGVRSVAYFCGVMAVRDGETPAQADARARADADEQLRNRTTALWPRFGEDLVVADYTRANVLGTDRYVLTPPGSVERRLRPGESGFEHLVLAGDWTRNGLCGGSVEAAIASGRLASQALCGAPAEVAGQDGWLEAD
jgi:uncharacterized protein with NAD-binding domain and iron-sulfur cluster